MLQAGTDCEWGQAPTEREALHTRQTGTGLPESWEMALQRGTVPAERERLCKQKRLCTQAQALQTGTAFPD